ncbi:MAG: hypothetical protein EpisKO_39220 [Epibacterium sp.]
MCSRRRLTQAKRLPHERGDGSPTPKAGGMKREFGAEEPKGAKSETAPATVSGERPVTAH